MCHINSQNHPQQIKSSLIEEHSNMWFIKLNDKIDLQICGFKLRQSTHNIIIYFFYLYYHYSFDRYKNYLINK